jgi:hypothetical protein
MMSKQVMQMTTIPPSDMALEPELEEETVVAPPGDGIIVSQHPYA